MADEVVTNGINGGTGNYLLQFADVAPGAARDRDAEAAFLHRQRNRDVAGPKFGVDPDNLASAGWGIVFPAGDPSTHAKVKDALRPLLALRECEAGPLFRIYEGDAGIRPGEDKRGFLKRHGVSFVPADPAVMPYYLLLAGGAEEISFALQAQLDLQRCVGRLTFSSPDDYRHYAEAVCASQKAAPFAERRMTLFGPKNSDDAATRMSCDELLAPLGDAVQRFKDWQVETILADKATKVALSTLLKRRPDLLFTASHGLAFDLDDPRQVGHQGALLCHDWPGPKRHHGQIPTDFYFRGDDLAAAADLTGMIAILFACYSLATPQFDEFAENPAVRTMIAPTPMISELPRRLLAQGTVAVIGHVDRAWSYSFHDPLVGPQIGIFDDLVARLANGERVGSAMKGMNERHAELAATLAQLKEDEPLMDPSERAQIRSIRVALNDARNYSVLGDPAVRVAQ